MNAPVPIAQGVTMEQLKQHLRAIGIEKGDIARMKYNARWERGNQPIEARNRFLELIRQEKETVRLIKLQRNPNWTPPVPRQRRPAPPKRFTTKSLGATKLDVPNDDACGICMEIHTLRESVHTSCGHCFGANCYNIYLTHVQSHGAQLLAQQYMQENAQFQHALNHMYQDSQAYACPMCRTKTPSLTAYKERATPKRRSTPIVL
jgi:hypothetical protein